MADGTILAAILDYVGTCPAFFLKLENLAAGGSYILGTGTSNYLQFSDIAGNTARVKISLTSEGYNTSRALGTIARTIYGTRPIALPRGANAANSDAHIIAIGAVTGGPFRDGETITQTGSGVRVTSNSSTSCSVRTRSPSIMRHESRAPRANENAIWVSSLVRTISRVSRPICVLDGVISTYRPFSSSRSESKPLPRLPMTWSRSCPIAVASTSRLLARERENGPGMMISRKPAIGSDSTPNTAAYPTILDGTALAAALARYPSQNLDGPGIL